MKNNFKVFLAWVGLMLMAPIINAQNLIVPYEGSNPDKKTGVCYNKSVTGPENGEYTVHLKSFVTGTVNVIQKDQPADIVLVLDVSGSMDDRLSPKYEAVQGSFSYNNYTEDLYYKDGNNYRLVRRNYEGRQNRRYYLYYSQGIMGSIKYLYDNQVYDSQNGHTVNNADEIIWTGTLYRYVGEGDKKIDALKESVESFIKEIQKNDLYEDEAGTILRKDEHNNPKPLGNQISIIKFANDSYIDSADSIEEGDDTFEEQIGNYWEGFRTVIYNYTQVVKQFTGVSNDSDVEALIKAVKGLEPGGATAVDFGLTKAQYLLANLSAERKKESAKTIVVFTDGSPTHDYQFDDQVANDAINIANTLKGTEYKAKIFTIGVFDNITTDITNYMNRVSSNFPTATSMTNPANSSLDEKDWKYMFDNSDPNMNLKDVFTTVAAAAGGEAGVEISSSAVVSVDVVSTSFKLPEGVTEEDVVIKTAKCNGRDEDGYLTFDEPVLANSSDNVSVKIDQNNNTISASGFDYSANFCDYDDENKVPTGKMLILEFPIKVHENAVGGPEVFTNDEGSGIYLTDPETGERKNLATFNRPTVAIPVNIWIQKEGLAEGESAQFHIQYREQNDPEVPASYKPFKTVILTGNKSGENAPMIKLLGLDPQYYYRIVEDPNWSWSYSNQAETAQTTLENKENPFKFKNEPKDTDIHHAEAKVTNIFGENFQKITVKSK